MKNKTELARRIFILILLLVPVSSVFAQTQKYQAAYIYNFTRYIEWPTVSTTGNFIIGVLGTGSPIAAELKAMAATKKVGNQTIEVVEFSSTSAITKCHILYIPSTKNGQTGSAIAATSGFKTVVVAEQSSGSNSGVDIGFLVVDEKLKFEINQSSIVKSGLKVSNELVQLATKVY